MSIKTTDDDLRIKDMKIQTWIRRNEKLQRKNKKLEDLFEDVEHRIEMCATGKLDQGEIMDQIQIIERILDSRDVT